MCKKYWKSQGQPTSALKLPKTGTTFPTQQIPLPLTLTLPARGTSLSPRSQEANQKDHRWIHLWNTKINNLLSRLCASFYCSKEGHILPNCPKHPRNRRACHSFLGRCRNFDKKGHIARNCMEGNLKSNNELVHRACSCVCDFSENCLP